MNAIVFDHAGFAYWHIHGLKMDADPINITVP
jgi:hypothetical protein